jgi:Tol biopolymer transport system component
MRRRSQLPALITLALVSVLLATLVSGAQAAFPGLDGKIVFVSTRDGNGDNYITGEGEIYVMNSNGANQTRLTFNAADDGDPAWSLTNRIVFQTNRDGDDEIGTMNPNGTGLIQLTNNTVPDYMGDWAASGLLIYFTRNPAGAAPTEIGVMNSDGTNQTRLTTNTDPESEPVSSPTGLYVAFASVGVGGVEDIFKMTAGGLLRTNLTNSVGLDFSPDWSSSL